MHTCTKSLIVQPHKQNQYATLIMIYLLREHMGSVVISDPSLDMLNSSGSNLVDIALIY